VALNIAYVSSHTFHDWMKAIVNVIKLKYSEEYRLHFSLVLILYMLLCFRH